MIRVQPSACFLIAALILLLPLDWLIAALLAAALVGTLVLPAFAAEESRRQQGALKLAGR